MSFDSSSTGRGPAGRGLPREAKGRNARSRPLRQVLILALCGVACCASGDGQPVLPAGDGPDETGTGETMIVILGASYAKGWEPRGIRGIRFENRGVGGQQSFEMLDRFREDVVLLEPRAVILWGYINDLFRSRPEKLAETKARARESFLEMIRLARENRIEPIAATEVTIRPEAGLKETLAGWVGRLLGKESYQDRINRDVREINDWLRELAAREGLLLLDFEMTLGGGDGRRKKEYALDDGSHITPRGYAALDAYAAPLLTERFGGGAAPATGD